MPALLAEPVEPAPISPWAQLKEDFESLGVLATVREGYISRSTEPPDKPSKLISVLSDIWPLTIGQYANRVIEPVPSKLDPVKTNLVMAAMFSLSLSPHTFLGTERLSLGQVHTERLY